MFTAHKLWAKPIRIRNIITIFLTIVCGFLSVMVFAWDINIETDIKNVWQTIARITITTDGAYQDVGIVDISSWGIYIDKNILQTVWYNGQLLWLNANGYITTISSEDLTIGTGTSQSWYWTDNGTNIWNTNIGSVGIGTNTIEGKLHIKGDTQTELYLEEIHEGSWTNINLKNTTNTRMIWWYTDRFYIGLNTLSWINILTNGNVGIGILTPQANLQISGTLIAWYNNSIAWIYASILWGKDNEVKSNYSSIGGGESNNVESIRWFIWWGAENSLHNNAEYSVIPGGYNNSISNAKYATIVGGRSNHIENATGSFSAGVKTQNSWYTNTFIWNSDESRIFDAGKDKSFLINVPLTEWENSAWGVGINVNNPQTALDVDGLIRTRPRYLHPNVACTNDTQWSIAYDISTQHFYGCNGSNRVQLDNM